MFEEIQQQPAAVQRTVQGERTRLARVAEEIRRRDPALVVIAARGTSDNAATYAKYLWGIGNSLPVALAAPALTTLYDATPRLRNALVVGISQSGESTDIVAVVRAARAQGAYTLAVTSAQSSTLAASADETALCHSGAERSVAATKTYTTQLAVLCLLSALLSGDAALLAALEAVPEAMARVLEGAASIAERAEGYRHMGACAVLGRGLNYCTALETALKMKETSYVVADPYSAADFQHGPIAIVDAGFPTLLFAPPGRAYAGMRRLADDLRARGAETLVFSSEQEILDAATTPLPLPPAVADGVAGEAISPLIYTVAGQLFAHALCRAKGLDPNHTRGLKKVTLTL